MIYVEFDMACLMADDFYHDWLVCTEFRYSLSEIIENCCHLIFFMTFYFYGYCLFDIIYLEFDGGCIT